GFRPASGTTSGCRSPGRRDCLRVVRTPGSVPPATREKRRRGRTSSGSPLVGASVADLVEKRGQASGQASPRVLLDHFYSGPEGGTVAQRYEKRGDCFADEFQRFQRDDIRIAEFPKLAAGIALRRCQAQDRS